MQRTGRPVGLRGAGGGVRRSSTLTAILIEGQHPNTSLLCSVNQWFCIFIDHVISDYIPFLHRSEVKCPYRVYIHGNLYIKTTLSTKKCGPFT